MARKRLSDLLREEVHKTAETEATPAPTNGKRASQSGRAKAASSGRAKAPVVETVEAVLVEADDQANSKEYLSQLRQELALSHQREAHLQQEMALLQTELDRQETRIHSLEADLEKAELLKTELDQAKKAALNLAEENTRLNQELTSLQGHQSAATPPPKSAPPKSTPPKSVPAVEPRSTTAIDQFQERQARSLAHPVFPAGASPGYLSDQDLGWVD